MAETTLPTIDPTALVTDALHAPIIFFEGVSGQGYTNGVLNISLVTAIHRTKGDRVDTKIVCVADLRFTVEAAKALKSAIDNALLLAMPVQPTAN